MLTQSQIEAKYGKANKTGAGYLTTIKLPYPMYLNWETKISGENVYRSLLYFLILRPDLEMHPIPIFFTA